MEYIDFDLAAHLKSNGHSELFSNSLSTIDNEGVSTAKKVITWSSICKRDAKFGSDIVCIQDIDYELIYKRSDRYTKSDHSVFTVGNNGVFMFGRKDKTSSDNTMTYIKYYDQPDSRSSVKHFNYVINIINNHHPDSENGKREVYKWFYENSMMKLGKPTKDKLSDSEINKIKNSESTRPMTSFINVVCGYNIDRDVFKSFLYISRIIITTIRRLVFSYHYTNGNDVNGLVLFLPSNRNYYMTTEIISE